MTRLVDLTLSRNTISYITPLAFADLENLRALHLNRYRWMDGRRVRSRFPQQHSTFATISVSFNLSVVCVSSPSNRLTRISNDTFSGMSKLHHLILNNNQLMLIHQGAFNDLLALEELDLSYNNLDSIPWEAIQVRNRWNLHTPVVLGGPRQNHIKIDQRTTTQLGMNKCVCV